MGNCLVTKLKASVDNDNLVKIGEMRVKFTPAETRTTSTHSLKVFGSEEITLKVIGTGFLATDINAVSGVTEVTIPATTDVNAVPMYYVSNTDCEISITSKYAVTFFRHGKNGASDIDDLKFSPGLNYININDSAESTGDLRSLADKTAITNLQIRGTKITGDLIHLANLTSMQYMLFSNTTIEGNISNLAGMTDMRDCQMNYTSNVYGDISTLNGMTSITKLSAVYCNKLEGDATWYISKTGLQAYYDIFNNTAVYADLSQLPASNAYVAVLGTAERTFTWTTQRHNVSGAKVVAIEASAGTNGVNFGSSLKTMLVDQSQCVFSPQGQSANYKTINVAGTYDSSDAELATAIATIKSNGWTVKINGVTV